MTTYLSEVRSGTTMELDDIRAGFTKLHGEASQLMREVLHTRPTVGLAVCRGALSDLEDRLDSYLGRFVTLDEEFIRHTTPPQNATTAMRSAAQFTLHGSLRDSVRGLLTDTSAALGSLRSQLDFRRSLLISTLAVIIAALLPLLGHHC